ncbi:O-antigen ligase family protein [Providencia rettgeri]
MFDNPNSLGLVLSLPLFLNLYSLLYHKNKKELLLSITSLILLIPLCLYSNSRTSLLAPLISIIIIMPIYFKKKSAIKLFLSLSLIVISLLIFSTLFSQVLNETILEKFTRQGTENISNGRIEYISQALQYLNYFKSSVMPSFIVIDNTYIAYAINFGMISSFFFLTISIGYFLLLITKRKLYSQYQFTFLAAYLIYYFLYSMLESIRITPLTLLFLACYINLISTRQPIKAE